MNLGIGHGHAIQNDRFRIEKGKWHHFTAEIRANVILMWFKDGPAHYMQHDHFRSKPAGFEFFTHLTEAGHLDNLQVWRGKSVWYKAARAEFVKEFLAAFSLTKPFTNRSQWLRRERANHNVSIVQPLNPSPNDPADRKALRSADYFFFFDFRPLLPLLPLVLSKQFAKLY